MQAVLQNTYSIPLASTANATTSPVQKEKKHGGAFPRIQSEYCFSIGAILYARLL